MKQILYITNHNPFSYSYGADQRASILLKALLANGHEVDIIMLGKAQPEPTHIPDKAKILYWKKQDFPDTSLLGRILPRLKWQHTCEDEQGKKIVEKFVTSKDYDALVARYTTFAISVGLQKWANKLYLDIDDRPSMAYSTINQDAKGLITRLKMKIVLSMMRHEENFWLKNAKCLFIPSSSQAEMLGVKYFPNIPVIHSDHSNFKGDNPTFLFIGLLSYEPNYQGVDHFITNIWPSVKTKYPKAIFRVAGKKLSASLVDKWSKVDGVQLLGFVESLEDFYASGDYVVCPIYSGAGTNIKVLEAMAMGKVCIMSKFASKGFEQLIESGKNAYVADTDEKYIEMIEQAISDKNKSAFIAESALRDCNAQYSQEAINKIIGEVIN